MTGNWKLAIQEDMLPGPTLEDRFAQAAELGLSGIEFWSAKLPEQANEIERLSGRGGAWTRTSIRSILRPWSGRR